jgi:hypothetical protein
MQLSERQRELRYADHCLVNAIIGRTIDAVQNRVVERLAPAMGVVDKMLGPIDEWLPSRLIAHWREEVWELAVLLLETPELGEREKLRQQVEATTLKRTNVILLVDFLTAITSLL